MRKAGRRDLERWSYAAAGAVPSGLVGVYAFWYRRTGDCVYVGMAADQPLGKRLRQHWNGSHNETLQLWIQAYGEYLDICYAQVQPRKIRTLERRLIRLWKPKANVQHNA